MMRKKLSKILKKMAFAGHSKSSNKLAHYLETKPVILPSEMLRLKNQRQRLDKD
jgi:hypothetical protein